MANEFVIKNGYFSQGNSNITGSLQVTGSVGVTGSASITGSLTSIGISTFSGSVLMTGSLNAIVSGAIDLTGFITASKIFITSSGNEQLMVIGSGSSSWITGIYGSQGNLLTVTDTFSGSVFTVTDISGYPILDVTSDYYTSSINTVGFLNHTGSAKITGSLIVNYGTYNVVDVPNFQLNDSNGTASIDWNNRFLQNGIRTPLDWDARELRSSVNDEKSIDWENRILYANNGVASHINWSNTSYMNFTNTSESSITRVLGMDNSNNVYWTSSTAFGGGGSGTGFPFSGDAVITGSLLVSQSGVTVTGSMFVSGAISASFGPNTVGFFGTASWAQSASFSPNFANTNLTFTNTRTHTGGGFEYRFFNSGSTIDYKGGNQLIRSYDHILGIREPKGGGNYETAFIQMTTSSLTIAVGDEPNATLGLRQLTITTSSISLTGSLNVSGSITGSLFGTASWATNALTASFWNGYLSTSSIIGNGLSSSFNINHGFNTRNLHITVYESSSNGETVYPDIRRINANTASIIFANPPSSSQYIVYISQ